LLERGCTLTQTPIGQPAQGRENAAGSSAAKVSPAMVAGIT
jgi:hypothetical protein